MSSPSAAGAAPASPPAAKRLLWLLRLPNAGWVHAWLLLQHSLLASSSIAFLHAVDQALRLSTAATVGNALTVAGPLLLFYATTVLPQYPRAAYSRALQRLQIGAARSQQETNAAAGYGKIWTWSDPARAGEADAAYSTQLPEATKAYVASTCEVSSRTISLAAHSLALSYLTSIKMLGAFAAAGAIAVVAIRLYKPSEWRAAADEQRASGALASIRHRFSDAVLRGERQDFALWQTDLAAATTSWGSAAVRSERLLSGHTRNTSLLCSLPILLVLLYDIQALTAQHPAPRDLSAALVSLLSLVPRILFNLEHGITLINQWPRAVAAHTRLAHAEAQLKNLAARRREVSVRQLSLCQSRFGVPGAQLSASALLVDPARLAQPGRFLLQGPNGAGKSTLLLRLKEQYGDKCVLISAADRDAKAQPGSTGERLVARVTAIVHKALAQQAPGVQLVLLDEWDAHLDRQKVQQLDTDIETLSEQMAVVEVRHAR